MITLAIIALILKWIRQNKTDEEIVERLKRRKIDGIIALRLVKLLRGSPAIREEQK